MESKNKRTQADIRKDWEKQLRAHYGIDWMDRHKQRLDQEWAYILEMGIGNAPALEGRDDE